MKERCFCGEHEVEANGAQYMAHGQVCCSRRCYTDALEAVVPQVLDLDGYMWGDGLYDTTRPDTE